MVSTLWDRLIGRTITVLPSFVCSRINVVGKNQVEEKDLFSWIYVSTA